MPAGRETAPCDKFTQNRTKSHSNLGQVDFCISSVDAMASVAARGHARRAVCSFRHWFPAAACEGTSHAIAMHGEPAWGPNFTHPTYANPAAPKGGQLVQGVLGTFDCLNPFIVKGLPAANIRGYVIESLLARGYDEPFTLYGLIAESVATDAARSFVTFAINPAARFSDGKPVHARRHDIFLGVAAR